MAHMMGGSPATPDALKLAIRVYPEPHGDEPKHKRGLRRWRRPPRMLVFDTETRTDGER